MPTKRHSFNGSRVALVSGYAATKAITAITKAKPAVATATAHGITIGAVTIAKIANAIGMVEANDTWIVKATDANSLELVGTDSTAWGTYTSGGTLAPATFGTWCEMKDFTQQSGSRSETVVSTICTEGFEEVELGLASGGTITMATNWAPDTAMQTMIDDLMDSGAPIGVQVQPKNAKTVTTTMAFVQSSQFSGRSGGVWEGSVTLRTSGRPIRSLTP